MKIKLPPAQSIKKLATDVAHEQKADVILYSGAIDEPSDFILIGKLKRYKAHPNVLLLLTTGGGSADSAYRIMRFLQHQYGEGKITVFINSYCKSAGTLMAVGSDELVMSDVAELGPLDVQVRKPDEVGEWSSGLTPLQALTALRGEAFNSFEQHFLLLREKSGKQITAKTAAEIAVKLTTGWFQPIYEQLDPMRLSETQRAMMIAWEYGQRLVRKNIDEQSLNRLISDYPSHGFIIDRHEAAELFCEVRGPTEAESKLVRALSVSRVIDKGFNGDEAHVAIISAEDCDIPTDSTWGGIEYEDEKQGNPTTPEKRSNSRSAARPRNAKSPARPKSAEERTAPSVDGNGQPKPVGNA